MSTEVARAALEKLLAIVERARVRGATPRGLLFSKASFPAYFTVREAAALEDLHSELASAARAGAIRISWDQRAGGRVQVTRIDPVNGDALAAHLRVIPHWVALETARVALQPFIARPQVSEILGTWSKGKRPRERGPEDVDRFVSALTVLAQLEGREGLPPEAVRRVSTRLLGASKNIEALAVELDLLTRLDDGPPRSADDLFAEIGLMRFAAPFVLSGPDGAEYKNPTGQWRSLERPYTGLDPRSLTGVRHGGRYILSIENWTLFRELADGHGGVIEGLLLYSAGMPSPRWIEAYRTILTESPEADILHWGDPDVGGIRAMARIARACHSAGRRLEPFAMDEAATSVRKPFTDTEVEYIVRVCSEQGWPAVGTMVQRLRGAMEQESQTPRLP